MGEKLISTKKAVELLGYKSSESFNAVRKSNKGFPQPKCKSLDGKTLLYSLREITGYAEKKIGPKPNPKERKVQKSLGLDNAMAYQFIRRQL